MKKLGDVLKSTLTLCVILIVFACQQNVPTSPSNNLENLTGKPMAAITALAVPDSIPAVVDEAALRRAQELHCSGVRLLLIEPEKSFLISFFDPLDQTTSQEGIVESRVIKFDYKNNSIISETLASSEILALAKPSLYSVCWLLAEVFEDAGYEGDSFTFSQETTTTGYFHKIIYNLAQSQSCCYENYPGTLNDCLSSHRWSYRDEGTIYTMVPDNFKVWRDAQRSGPNHNFDAQRSGCDSHCYDDNWIDETWLDGLVYVTINDKVSSIDMSYWVVDYNDCP